MALTTEEREKLIQDAVDEYAPKMANDVIKKLKTNSIIEYTDEELLQNSIDEEYANSYEV